MIEFQLDFKLVLFLFSLPIFFISLAVHEFSHAFFAYRFGDPTAKNEGRLTLNPIKHIDPVGSLLMPLLAFFSGFALIGWAKPVPVNPSYFSNQRRDDAIVSLMGPVSNFILCFVFAFLTLFFKDITILEVQGKIIMLNTLLWYGVLLNIFLALFNLLPIPPLDGFHIIHSIFYNEFTFKLMRLGIFGTLILLLFIYSPFWKYFNALIFYIFDIVKKIFN